MNFPNKAKTVSGSRPVAGKTRRFRPGRLLYTVFFVFPLMCLLVRSFSGIWRYPRLWPSDFNARAFSFILENCDPIMESLLSSLMYSLLTVIFTILICLPAARVISRRNFTGKTAVEFLLMAPILVPSMLFALGLYPVLFALNFTDNLAAVVLVLGLASFPYMMRALVSGFDSYSPNLDDTARMLGGTALGRIMDIHVPQLLPALLGGSTVVFLVAFTEYFLVFMIGGGVVRSYAGYLVPLIRSGDWNVGSALSLLFVIIPIALYGLLDATLNRYYRSRYAQGGST